MCDETTLAQQNNILPLRVICNTTLSENPAIPIQQFCQTHSTQQTTNTTTTNHFNINDIAKTLFVMQPYERDMVRHQMLSTQFVKPPLAPTRLSEQLQLNNHHQPPPCSHADIQQLQALRETRVNYLAFAMSKLEPSELNALLMQLTHLEEERNNPDDDSDTELSPTSPSDLPDWLNQHTIEQANPAEQSVWCDIAETIRASSAH
jgi:hypothetical protein